MHRLHHMLVKQDPGTADQIFQCVNGRHRAFIRSVAGQRIKHIYRMDDLGI